MLNRRHLASVRSGMLSLCPSDRNAYPLHPTHRDSSECSQFSCWWVGIVKTNDRRLKEPRARIASCISSPLLRHLVCEQNFTSR